MVRYSGLISATFSEVDGMRGLAPAIARRPVRRHAVSASRLVLSLHYDLATLRETWIDFEDKAETTVFQTYEWLAAYQRFIGARRGETPCIAIARANDGSIACLLPLAIRRSGALRELVWLGDELCDYNGPLLAPDFSTICGPNGFATLWRDLLAELQAQRDTSFDIVRLTKMPRYVGSQENPLTALSPTTLNPSGSYAVTLADNWDAFYAAKRSSSTRARERGKRKKLAECGELVFRTQSGAENVARALHTLAQQKGRMFAERGIGNIFVRPGYAEFYRAVASDPNFSRIAHVSTLDVGAETAAVNLGLIFRDRYYYVLSSYTDGPAARFSPGTVHLHELMRYAIGRGVTSFDFTIGDEPYKRDWCDGVRPLYDYIATATLSGALIALPLQVIKRLKRTIKQTPVLWSLFTKARAAFRHSVKSADRNLTPGARTASVQEAGL